MNASLLKHFKERTDGSLSCIDDYTHTCVIQLRSSDATFVLNFKDISKPADVKQISGKARNMNSDEISEASGFLGDFLRGAITESLLEDEVNVIVAKKIMRALGHDDFFKHVVLAKKLITADGHESMASMIADSTGIDSSDPNGLIKGIVSQVRYLLNDMLMEKR